MMHITNKLDIEKHVLTMWIHIEAVTMHDQWQSIKTLQVLCSFKVSIIDITEVNLMMRTPK